MKGLKELDCIHSIFGMTPGEKATFEGYEIHAFYYEDRIMIDPNILGGVNVYKDGKHVAKIRTEEELDDFIENYL